MDYKYIIVYNAESDFIGVYTGEQVKSEVATIIKDGQGHSDIEVYKVERVDFEVKSAQIEIDIKEE